MSFSVEKKLAQGFIFSDRKPYLCRPFEKGA
jgi:hypothetical protein